MRFWSVLLSLAAVASLSGCKDKDSEKDKKDNGAGNNAAAGGAGGAGGANQPQVPAGGQEVPNNGKNTQVNKQNQGGQA